MTRARNSFPFVIQGRPADAERVPVAEFASVTHRILPHTRDSIARRQSLEHADIVASSASPSLTTRSPIATGPVKIHSANRSAARPPTAPWITIVGVVGTIKSDGFDAPAAPHVYSPLYQNPNVTAAIYLRTNGDPSTLGDQIRHEVQSVDPGIPVFAVRTMDEVVAKSLADRRFALVILAVFAGVALLLASIGIYGVMAYTFSQRTHEIGVRVALGAQRSDILRMALGEGMLLVAIGLGAGLIGATIVTRFLRSMLFSVTPTDPATFGAIAALLAAVALFACFIPARRATQVDPLVALRED